MMVVFGGSKHTWILLVSRSRNASMSCTLKLSIIICPQMIFHFVFVGHDSMLHVFHHGLLYKPVPQGMGDVPSRWKHEVRMTTWGFSFVNYLNWKKIARQRSTENSCLSVTPTISTCFEPYSSIVQVEKGTTLIPVCSQFKMSLTKILFMLTVANTLFRSVFFCSAKFALLALLLAVVAFLCTNFMHFSSEWAHCLLTFACPPNSASLHTSVKWPQAAAIAADTTPPPSLTLFRYSCSPTLHQGVVAFHAFSREEQQYLLHLWPSTFELPRRRSS